MIWALAALACLFLVLLWQVQTGGALVILDGVVNASLRPFRTRLPVAGFTWLAQFGTGGAGVAVALAASGLFWSDGRTRLILPLWIGYFGAQATTWPLKFVTARARPPFIEGVTAASPSFPSAHATVSTVIFGFIGLAIAAGLPAAQQWTAYAAAALLVLLIWFSRIFLSLHYLTDVLAGGAVGAFWMILGWRLASM